MHVFNAGMKMFNHNLIVGSPLKKARTEKIVIGFEKQPT